MSRDVAGGVQQRARGGPASCTFGLRYAHELGRPGPTQHAHSILPNPLRGKVGGQGAGGCGVDRYVTHAPPPPPSAVCDRRATSTCCPCPCPYVLVPGRAGSMQHGMEGVSSAPPQQHQQELVVADEFRLTRTQYESLGGCSGMHRREHRHHQARARVTWREGGGGGRGAGRPGCRAPGAAASRSTRTAVPVVVSGASCYAAACTTAIGWGSGRLPTVASSRLAAVVLSPRHVA